MNRLSTVNITWHNISLLTCLLLGALSAGSLPSKSIAGSAEVTAADLKPHRMRCEHLVDPLGLEEPAPRLSWALRSKTNGNRQSSYRILVASSPEELAADRGDLWDSGKIDSDQTIQITYQGAPLKSFQRACWKVRSWDQDGQPGPWSPPATWEMAILESSEWTAEWIGAGDDRSHDKPLPLLRKDFSLHGEVARARAYVCGVGYFELYVNGQRIGDARLTPGYTRYDKRLLYETLDVTDALRADGNALGVMLGNGWYNVATRAPWNFDRVPWRASPRVICQVMVEYADGSTETIVSDPSWKTSPGPITYSSIYSGESYDAQQEQEGWSEPDFDDTDWSPAVQLDTPGGRLVAAASPPIRVIKQLQPAKITRQSDRVAMYDFGQNMAGFVELNASGPAGSEVRMVYSELLGDDGAINQQNIATHVWSHGKDQRFQTDTYTLKGEGRESWRCRFTYHGYRYVEVTADPAVLDDLELTACVAHTDLKPIGTFECSNPLLNKIWTAACWAYLSNFQSIPTDCPHREKNGWTGDAHLACEFGLLNFDGAAAYTKWINDLQDEQQDDGRLPGIVPTSGWGYHWGNGPAWDSAYLLIPDYLRTYCGDTRLLDRQYEGHRRYVDYLEEKSDNLIANFGLGDWAAWKAQTPDALTSTGYFFRDTQIVAETANRLEDADAAQHYEELASNIRKAFNKEFWNADTNAYNPLTQTALSCALYQGLVDPAHRDATVDALVAKIHETDDHIDTGILGSKYVLTALSDNGHADVAYRMSAQKTQPSWGWWIEQGATTLWEQWTTADSQNHIMYGDVAAWFTKALVGLSPDNSQPGFSHVIVCPNPVGDLTWARATHDSPCGPIEVSWRKQDGQFNLDVALPANVSATVYLPTTDASQVTLGGKPVDQNEHAKATGADNDNGRATIEVGSGKHSFSAPL